MTDTLVDKISKKFPSLIILSDSTSVESISTGSFSLDVSTGIGGIPKGKVTTIFGPYSSGKTSLCLEIARNAIANGERVAYIDVENSLEYDRAEKIVGDTSGLLIVQPETAEDALNLAEDFIHGDKELGLESGYFDVIIVDSVAALAPEIEKKKKLEDRNIALTAGILTSFFRRNMYGIMNSNVALIFVNQVRAKIGSYHGGYDYPGGYALKHYSSVVILLTVGEKYTVGEEITGVQCKYVINKNKLAPPYRSGSFPLMFDSGIDTYRDAIEFAKRLGVVKARGAYMYFGEEKLGMGMIKSMNYIRDNPEVLDKIREACYNIANRYTRIQPDNDEILEGDVE